jgi:hypothetical protein
MVQYVTHEFAGTQGGVKRAGSGKTWIACALAQQTCWQGNSVLYWHVPRLMEELRIAHGDASYMLASARPCPWLEWCAMRMVYQVARPSMNAVTR